MKLISQPLPGIHVLEPFIHRDPRGDFVKPFHEAQLRAVGIEFTLREEFFSTSAKDVVRGMHFQLPPHQHHKLVYCIAGRVLDVVLDLRKDSATFGHAAGVELSAENHYVISIPVGFAHGFASLEDGSCLVYKTDAMHAPSHDAGIRWDSFGFQWPGFLRPPVLSSRDLQHPELNAFSSPF